MRGALLLVVGATLTGAVPNAAPPKKNGTATGLAYVSLGWFWTSECNFEGAKLAGLKITADPSSCPTGASSVSDKECTPSTTVVGYMGGTGMYPNYQNYTAGNNYSETLRLVYDPSELSYEEILKTYWEYAPDPTMPEPDPAYQLRIFYVDDEQKAAAEASIAAQKKATPGTLIDLFAADDYTFWKAEEYHQHYFDKGGQQCTQAQAQLPSRGKIK